MDSYSHVSLETPTGWTLEHDRKKVFDEDDLRGKWVDDKRHSSFKREGTFAGNCTHYSDVHEIELRHHYNGGGPQAFGGVQDWPCITAKISFNSGEEELAAKFATELGTFVDTWMKARNR